MAGHPDNSVHPNVLGGVPSSIVAVVPSPGLKHLWFQSELIRVAILLSILSLTLARLFRLHLANLAPDMVFKGWFLTVKSWQLLLKTHLAETFLLYEDTTYGFSNHVLGGCTQTLWFDKGCCCAVWLLCMGGEEWSCESPRPGAANDMRALLPAEVCLTGFPTPPDCPGNSREKFNQHRLGTLSHTHSINIDLQGYTLRGLVLVRFQPSWRTRTRSLF